MLHGKGIYIWEVQECENGDPHQIVAQALAAGLQHALVKVCDGSGSFPGPLHESKTVAAINVLRGAGLEVWGWGFVYGEDPIGDVTRAVEFLKGL